MRIRVTDILSLIISVILVIWILEYFGFNVGVLICGIFALVVWLIADILGKIAKVTRATVEQLQKK